MLTHIDLFSGIGGFALAARWAGFETIAFAETDEYCSRVLKKHWPEVPNYGDVRNVRGIRADLVTGGFPCQPFSCAGKRKGKEDDRFLWPAMLEVIADARPAWVIGENVPGIINMELERVLSDLEGLGFEIWPTVVPAVAIDAPHRRDRVWIVAYNQHGRVQVGRRTPNAVENGGKQGRIHRNEPSGREQQKREALADADNAGLSERRRAESVSPKLNPAELPGQTLPDGHSRGQPECKELDGYALHNPANRDTCREHADRCSRPARWEPEPDVGRVAHGIPCRVDRLRALGNSIVPQVAYQIFKAINEIENQ